MNGYREAEKVDMLINRLLGKEGISEKNAHAWLAYTRTIISGLEILRKEAELLLEAEQIAKYELDCEVDFLLKKTGPIIRKSI